MTQNICPKNIDMGYQKTQNSMLIQNSLIWTVKNVPELSYRQKTMQFLGCSDFALFQGFLLIPFFGTIS